MLKIQVQMNSGIWQTVSSVINNSVYIDSSMKSISKLYPGKRLRAIDENSRIVDIR